MLLWPYNTTEQQRVETAWLAEAVSRKKKLKGHRAFAMSPWMAALDPAASSLFQIGANKHESTSYINNEPGPLAVHHGWKSTLLEPIPDIFKQLQRTYTPQPPNVELVNAAVCDQCAAAPLKMWSVDMSNATGNWGSNDSDARCLTANTPGGNGSHFVSEIASLSKCSAPCANRDQTQAHSSRPPSADAPSGRTCSATIATLPWGQTSVLSAQRYSAGRCQTTACARRLDEGEGDMRGSPSSLTLSCHATQVIANNLVTFPVRCYCAETELVPQLRHAQRGGAAALSLLVRASREINERGHGCVRASHAQNNRVACEAVDAEGHDDAALYQFPFALVRPARVVFESTHLTSLRFLRCARLPTALRRRTQHLHISLSRQCLGRLAEFLRSYGYEMLSVDASSVSRQKHGDRAGLRQGHCVWRPARYHPHQTPEHPLTPSCGSGITSTLQSRCATAERLPAAAGRAPPHLRCSRLGPPRRRAASPEWCV